MAGSQSHKNKQETPLASALDSFNATVSHLGSSYDELKKRIEELNVQMSEKNKHLEKNFFEVNRIRWFFDSILNSMTDGVIVVDTSGNIVLFNAGVEKLTGYTGGEVLGKSYSDVFGKRTSQRFSPLYTLAKGDSLILEEKEIEAKSGQRIPVRYSTSLVLDNQARVLGAVEVLSDLSRIKGLEKEMQNVKTQTALNQMAGLVAHEIRNPLGGIRGYVDLLSESFDENDSRSEMVDLINKSMKRLDETIANFNLFTRPVKPNFQKLDIKQFLKDVLSFFEQSNGLADKNVQVAVQMPEDALDGRIDPILLEQVLMIVLDNGVKAMSSGGDLRIELKQNVSPGKNIKGQLFFIIADNGEGMARDVADKLFTPFFTTREKGMGLGLALAKNFVSLHQGDIFVNSEPGIGTTVTIALPIM